MSVRTLFWIFVAQATGGTTPAITKLALAGVGPCTRVVLRQLLGERVGALALVGAASIVLGTTLGALRGPEALLDGSSASDWVPHSGAALHPTRRVARRTILSPLPHDREVPFPWPTRTLPVVPLPRTTSSTSS